MPSHPAIIAAVDLDSRASGIIRQGAKVADLCRGELLVVHVVDDQSGFESDRVPFQTRRQAIAEMVRHARASLVGMVHHLDLPTSHVGIRVESGPTATTLVELAAALHPRYFLVGQSRWGPASPKHALTKALAARPGCELVIVADSPEVPDRQLLGRARDWLAGARTAPSEPAS